MCLTAIVGSSLLGAASSSRAASAQRSAARDQLELNERVYDEQTGLFRPFVNAGTNALNAFLYELGLGDAPVIGATTPQVVAFDDTVTTRREATEGDRTPTVTNSTVTRYRVGDQVFATEDAANAYAQANATGGREYGGYTQTPGYDFRLNEGLGALEGSAAARGGLFSGNAMKSALQYGQDYATSEYDRYLARLSGIASSGQNAAGMQGAAAQNYGASGGNALAAMGNASAAGAIGFGSALQSGIQNLVGWNGYQSAQNSNNGTLGTLFGGSWAIN